MSDRIFIEQVLANHGILIEKTAHASVAGGWYIWYPPSYHTDIIRETDAYFDWMSSQCKDCTTWHNWHAEMDSMLLMFSDDFRSTTECFISFNAVNGEYALVFMIKNNLTNLLAFKVVPLKDNSTLDIFLVNCALSGVESTFSSKRAVDKKKNSLSIFQVASAEMWFRGNAFSICKWFLPTSAAAKIGTGFSDFQKLMGPTSIQTLFYETIKYSRYSFWKRLLSYLPFVKKWHYRDSYRNATILKF